MILAREYFNDATTATKPISIKVSNVDGYDIRRDESDSEAQFNRLMKILAKILTKILIINPSKNSEKIVSRIFYHNFLKDFS